MKDFVLSLCIHGIEHGCLCDAMTAQAIVANTSRNQSAVQKACDGAVKTVKS
jgi:hypothetical protein